jgi:hypothetical protein
MIDIKYDPLKCSGIGKNIETTIIDACNKYCHKSDIINKFSENFVATNILIDYITESQGVLCINESNLFNLFIYKLSQFLELSNNKLPIQKMHDYYKKLRDLIGNGMNEDDAHNKLNNMSNKIFSDENYAIFNSIVAILNNDIIATPRSEVFMLEQLDTLVNTNEWESVAFHLRDNFLKFNFHDPKEFPMNEYDTNFYNIMKGLWTDRDTDILQLICKNYTACEAAASFFFFNLFMEDGRWIYIKNNLPDSWIKKQGNYIQFKSDASTFDDAFRYFSGSLVYENGIEHGAIIKKCNNTNVFFIENIHAVKLEQFNLYCPYYEMYNQNNNISETESLSLLLQYSKILGKCPSIQDLDNPKPNISLTKPLIDLWVGMPNSDFYKKYFGSIKNAYKAAKIL